MNLVDYNTKFTKMKPFVTDDCKAIELLHIITYGRESFYAHLQ